MFFQTLTVHLFFIFFLKSIHTFNPKDIKSNDLSKLEQNCHQFMNLELQSHEYYAPKTNEQTSTDVYYPYPGDGDYPDCKINVPNFTIVGKTLAHAIALCVREETKSAVGYAITLNAIESTGLTYLHTLSKLVAEANRQSIRVSNLTKDFQKLLTSVEKVFKRKNISLEPIECFQATFKFYDPMYSQFEYKNYDHTFVVELEHCMEAMEKKLNFTKLETFDLNIIDKTDKAIGEIKHSIIVSANKYFHSNIIGELVSGAKHLKNIITPKH